MSERPAQLTARPPQQHSKADQPTLTAAERAEREIAQIDQQMDLIMNKSENQASLVNPETNALQPPAGRSVTPGVSAGADPAGMTQMVMNFVIPGSGTLMRGIYGTGAVQLGMAVAALPTLLLVKWWLGILLGVIAWVWSAATGIKLYSQSTARYR
jgi:TM2 domain-containing membrane protein YozV